jgi:hypothetical protein
MVEFLIKVSGSLFVGGLGLLMIIFSLLILTVAFYEIRGYIENIKEKR